MRSMKLPLKFAAEIREFFARNYLSLDLLSGNRTCFIVSVVFSVWIKFSFFPKWKVFFIFEKSSMTRRVRVSSFDMLVSRVIQMGGVATVRLPKSRVLAYLQPPFKIRLWISSKNQKFVLKKQRVYIYSVVKVLRSFLFARKISFFFCKSNSNLLSKTLKKNRSSFTACKSENKCKRVFQKTST